MTEEKIPMVMYWCGEPIDDMEKPQLLEIIKWLADEVDYVRKQAQRDMDFLCAPIGRKP